ncbi:DUF2637 domain-containing protein [Streptomyces sp. R44]|uniref:DUF2637 domain-containing protein n=1 Tax=Streptomyces sp. R44 TaxID=3238633 RepID=A0AB39T8P1_9ACTN
MLKKLRHVDPILIQAVIAAALSFAHIHDVAETAGQTGWKAWAYPVSVDVLLAVAWKMMRTRGGVAAWFWFLVAMAASLGANVATSGVMNMANPPGWVRVVVAGWPAVAFLGGTLLVHRRKDAVVDEVPEEPQAPAEEPAGTPEAEGAPEPLKPPQPPVLVTYREAADALRVSEGTVRGWAHRGQVSKHPGHTPSTVRVDLRECRTYQAGQLVSP